MAVIENENDGGEGSGGDSPGQRNGAMAKEMIGTRVDAPLRNSLEELARANGRRLAEEVAVALQGHVATSAILAVPGPIGPTTRVDPGSLGPTMDVDAVVGFAGVAARLADIRSVPPSLNPVVALLYDAFCGQVDPDPAVVGGWLDRWLDESVGHLGTARLGVLQALDTAHLLEFHDDFRERRAELVEVLSRMARRHSGVERYARKLRESAATRTTTLERAESLMAHWADRYEAETPGRNVGDWFESIRVEIEPETWAYCEAHTSYVRWPNQADRRPPDLFLSALRPWVAIQRRWHAMIEAHADAAIRKLEAERLAEQRAER